jgi:predicted ATP-grasp superfamily ATP-dependent carboligase
MRYGTQHGMIITAPHDRVEVRQIQRVGAEDVTEAASEGHCVRIRTQRTDQRAVVISLATMGTDHKALHEVDYRYQLQGSAMRIFVFEYITGGGYAGRPMVAELAREGDLMLNALIRDLDAIPDVEVCTTRDTRLPDLGFDIEVQPVSSRAELLRAWSVAVAEADAVWPIAPETEGVLELLSGWVEMAGRRLLSSRPDGVQIAGSKLATSRRLDERGVAVVPTWRPMDLMPIGDGCWVLKPDRGVGCVGARLIRGQRMLADAVADLPDFEDWVLQPYLSGQAASLSLLVGNGQVDLLGCNVQRIVLDDDQFILLGCEVNGLRCERLAYEQLGRAVVDALPGLWGYVGVDLAITDEGPVVLEVNPRLTTSYIGLSESLGCNVAAMVVDLIRPRGGEPEARSRPRRVDVDLEQFHVA